MAAWCARVTVLTSAQRSDYDGVPKHQLAILELIGVPVVPVQDAQELPDALLIVDAIIGYSLRGAPRGVMAQLIRKANGHKAPVLSLDVPSGMETTTGNAHDPTIKASATLTLALPKTGFKAPGAAEYLGEVYLADISVPPELYASPTLGIDVGPIFAQDDIIRLF